MNIFEEFIVLVGAVGLIINILYLIGHSCSKEFWGIKDEDEDCESRD